MFWDHLGQRSCTSSPYPSALTSCKLRSGSEKVLQYPPALQLILTNNSPAVSLKRTMHTTSLPATSVAQFTPYDTTTEYPVQYTQSWGQVCAHHHQHHHHHHYEGRSEEMHYQHFACAVSTPVSPEEAVLPLQYTCDTFAGQLRDSSASASDNESCDGVQPPQTLTLPFAVLREYPGAVCTEEEEEEEEEQATSPDTRRRLKKKLKKQKKKMKKRALERPDPRLDAGYWLYAPTANECCISPVDEYPVPYELLASM